MEKAKGQRDKEENQRLKIKMQNDKSKFKKKNWPRKGLEQRSRNQKIKERLLRIRRMFFAFAFLFTASAFCEGGEKRTTAKNKEPDITFYC